MTSPLFKRVEKLASKAPQEPEIMHKTAFIHVLAGECPREAVELYLQNGLIADDVEAYNLVIRSQNGRIELKNVDLEFNPITTTTASNFTLTDDMKVILNRGISDVIRCREKMSGINNHSL